MLMLPLLLGGCLPTAVVVAGYVADGASLVATGKTVSDHGISAATLRDCALWRTVQDDPICKDRPGGNTVPVIDGRMENAAAKEPAPPPMAGRFVVIGSFADRERAEAAAGRVPDWHPTIAAVSVDGRLVHRVVVGPIDDGLAQRLLGSAGHPGEVPGAWERKSAPVERASRSL